MSGDTTPNGAPMAFDPPPQNKKALEEGASLTPRFNADGLIQAITVDAADDALLMVAWMNDEALRLTIETSIAHYWSRSRAKLWKKGETSGNLQHVREMRIDCDQDAILLKVDVAGHDATCHTGRRSCFYRRIETDASGQVRLVDDGSTPLFDSETVYGR